MSDDVPREDHADPTTTSFKLTTAFLSRHRRYQQTLCLNPDIFRFDPVLWRSGLATLIGLLRNVAEEEGLDVTPDDVDEAVRNLVEGIVLKSREWDG